MNCIHYLGEYQFSVFKASIFPNFTEINNGNEINKMKNTFI